MTNQDWINDLCLRNEVVNTNTLDKQQLIDWMKEYNQVFNTYVEMETFKRYLREGKEYAREQLGLNAKSSNKPKVVPPAKDMGNILVVADLHEPYTREGYLEFCVEMYKKHDCQTVIFIGDIMDNHFSSFHDTDPDADYSGLGEILATKKNMALWHKTFPNAYVCLGNHDKLGSRKAFSAGLSSSWIKSIGEVLDTPTWTFSDEFIFDNVKYTHGTGRKARQRMQQDIISVVQGHYHSESYIDFAVGISNRLFAMQLGSGINDKSFAFAYGKHFAKSHINVGIVKDKGTLPIIEYMDLNKKYK